MPDYINFHNRNLFTKKIILLIINFLILIPDKLFCILWNIILLSINNSVRISLLKGGTFLVKDKTQSIEIVHKKRFEFYLQNINTRLNHISYEYMLDAIKINPGDTIVDCGANIGELFLSIKQNHQEDIKYYGFEPAPREYNVLNNNSKNLVKKPLALSADSEERKFYVRSKTADSSFEVDRNQKEIIVECKSIDEYFKEVNTIALLKLEAEGYELDVLLGASKSLPKIKYITADLGFELENNTKSSFDSVNKFLQTNSFELLSSTKRLTYLYKNLKHS